MKVDKNLIRYLNIDMIQQASTIAISIEKYIGKGAKKIKAVLGSLRKEKSPIEVGANIELDDSLLLESENHEWYHSLIGIALWVAILC